MSFPPDYQIVYQHLLDQKITENIAIEIISNILKQHGENETAPTLAQIFQFTKQEIKTRLQALSFNGMTYDQQIVHFVGPTGVGKTTTLAKVAASCMLKDDKKVAFITADTYRIAAIDQLKTYAQILDVPLEVAYNRQDYQASISKFADYDLILVDTEGRNFRNQQYIEELNKNIAFDDNMATYLVLSLTAKPKDLLAIYQQFRDIPVKKLIFTKMDETRQYGSMLNVMMENDMGIACLTNGQNVPDDLLNPSADMLINFIVGEIGDT
jgi:flagellar biosynthesis protein FlhF